MGIVALHGMRVHGKVGVSEVERRIGRTIVADVEVHASLQLASTSDDIGDILNYELLADAVDHALQQEHKLLEAVAQHIATYIIEQYAGKIEDMHIRLSKENPFVGMETAASFVEWRYLEDYKKI